jgi:hypothetical protein
MVVDDEPDHHRFLEILMCYADVAYFLMCFELLFIYCQSAKLYCCQSSLILPFEMRKRSKPVTTYFGK